MTVPTTLLKDKKIAVFGVANKWSIAWAITQSLAAAGARIALTYIDERTEEKVRSLAAALPHHPLVLPCDVTKDDQIESVFNKIKHEFGALDGLIHAIAYARKEELEGSFLKTTREGFQEALDVSAYSLTALARGAAPLMQGRDGCIVTLSFLGGFRVVPNYNVMGVAKAALETSVRYLAAELGSRRIRVNCISAGPINTLAARGISNFHNLLSHTAGKAPLQRNIDADEVADTALYLCSHLARGVTGEILYVDAGYHIIGV
ncbi:MAG: enoyl-ACP reductase [Elusimicrobia bacterium RIFCSPLOWO2_01_FULL_59_12]|nr:MAG: enoyl-ACP reductase [Elusimicrobia bacterium RIFCSPLOWO2_01_FULL_59_12]